jgi:acetyl esterase/lipase
MRTILFLFTSFLLIAAESFAQSFTLPLWTGNIPNYRKTDEVEVRDSSDIIRISNVQIPDITVYLPAKRYATGQAVVICPGGGYVRLAYDLEGLDIAKWLNSKGIAAIVLKYRLPITNNNIVGYKSPLLDAKRAIRTARYYASDWNIDKNKIGVMGFSAGGHLASTLGTHFDYGDPNAIDEIDRMSSRPDFMILCYPVITFTKPFMHRGSRDALLGKNPDSSLIKFYSNELQVKDDTPPTFIVHADDDGAVPVENSLVFYEALRQKKIPVEIHIYPEGGHGFGLALGRGHLESWTDRCIDWIRWINNKK